MTNHRNNKTSKPPLIDRGLSVLLSRCLFVDLTPEGIPPAIYVYSHCCIISFQVTSILVSYCREVILFFLLKQIMNFIVIYIFLISGNLLYGTDVVYIGKLIFLIVSTCFGKVLEV